MVIEIHNGLVTGVLFEDGAPTKYDVKVHDYDVENGDALDSEGNPLPWYHYDEEGDLYMEYEV